MGERTIHMRLDVRGVLMKNNRELKPYTRWMLRKDGTRYTVDELRAALLDELAEGRAYLPLGDCPGFDFKKGCPGHPARVPMDPDAIPAPLGAPGEETGT